MRPISAPLIVFDLDGTLIDSLPDIANSCRTLLKNYDLPLVTDHEVRAMIGDGIKVTVERLLNHIGKDAHSINREEALNFFIKDYFLHGADTSHPFTGAKECLEEFKQKGWKIAVCTNKLTEAAEIILKKFNLTSYFGIIAGGDRFANKKPDPCHIEGILHHLSADPSKTVMVGDHHNDIAVAHNAHLAGSIFAEWGYGNAEVGQEATFTANSLSQVPQLAEKIIQQHD